MGWEGRGGGWKSGRLGRFGWVGGREERKGKVEGGGGMVKKNDGQRDGIGIYSIVHTHNTSKAGERARERPSE